MSLFKIKNKKLQKLENKFLSEMVKMHLNNYKNHSESKIKEYEEVENLLKEIKQITSKWDEKTKEGLKKAYEFNEKKLFEELKFLYENSIKDCIKFLTFGEMNKKDCEEILNYKNIVNYSFGSVVGDYTFTLRVTDVEYMKLEKLQEDAEYLIKIMKYNKVISINEINLLKKLDDIKIKLNGEEINYIYVEGFKDCLKSLM